jgi:hypothetical protein
MDNLVDPPGRDADLSRQAILTDPHGVQKLLEKHFPGMNWPTPLPHHKASLMVIDYLHIVRVTVKPHESDAPLVIDSNAVLPKIDLQRVVPVGFQEEHGGLVGL